MELLERARQVPAGARAGSQRRAGGARDRRAELSPIIPHVTHALWRSLGHSTALIDERWPAVDAAALQQSTVQMVVQVNGKLRAHITVPANADERQSARRGARRCARAEIHRRRAGSQSDRRARQARQRGGVDARGHRGICVFWPRAAAAAVSGSRAASICRPVLAKPYLSVKDPVHRFLARVRASAEELGRTAAARAARTQPPPSRSPRIWSSSAPWRCRRATFPPTMSSPIR